MFVASSSLNIHLHQDRQTDKQTWRFINFIIIIIIIIFFFLVSLLPLVVKIPGVKKRS